jgi:hypothetical protein
MLGLTAEGKQKYQFIRSEAVTEGKVTQRKRRQRKRLFIKGAFGFDGHGSVRFSGSSDSQRETDDGVKRTFL